MPTFERTTEAPPCVGGLPVTGGRGWCVVRGVAACSLVVAATASRHRPVGCVARLGARPTRDGQIERAAWTSGRGVSASAAGGGSGVPAPAGRPGRRSPVPRSAVRASTAACGCRPLRRSWGLESDCCGCGDAQKGLRAFSLDNVTPWQACVDGPVLWRCDGSPGIADHPSPGRREGFEPPTARSVAW
jgi:hypothetical protein